MEWWQVTVGLGGLLVPVVIAAFARDRQLLGMIQQGKDDTREHVEEAAKGLHERVNRVRDEYVSHREFTGYVQRVEKGFDELKEDLRRQGERTDVQLRELKQMIGSAIGLPVAKP